MKKIGALLIIVALSYQLNAQDSFSLGPKIGATFSKFTTDLATIKEEGQATFHYGAFARIGRRVYVQPEFLLMKLNTTSTNDSLENISVRTASIPLLIGVHVFTGGVANVRLFAGPVASFTVDKELKSIDINKDDIRNANWSLQFGGGVDFSIFTFDLRYEMGMSEWNKEYLNSFSLKNNSIIASLGLKLL